MHLGEDHIPELKHTHPGVSLDEPKDVVRVEERLSFYMEKWKKMDGWMHALEHVNLIDRFLIPSQSAVVVTHCILILTNLLPDFVPFEYILIPRWRCAVSPKSRLQIQGCQPLEACLAQVINSNQFARVIYYANITSLNWSKWHGVTVW